jgi:fibronectin type 3 domain-containing protein
MARDVAPPASPVGVRAIAGLGTIEIAWDANRESDIAGYRLFRSTGGDWTRVGGDLNAPAFTDRDVQSGKAYRYAVAAFDTNGNESARSAPADITAP